MSEPVQRARRLLRSITPLSGETTWREDPDPELPVTHIVDNQGTRVATSLWATEATFIAAAPQLIADLAGEVDRMSRQLEATS